METILPNLSYLRRKAGLSQQSLAHKLGITAMSVSNYESGRNAPSAKTMLAIAEALNVSVDELLSTHNQRS